MPATAISIVATHATVGVPAHFAYDTARGYLFVVETVSGTTRLQAYDCREALGADPRGFISYAGLTGPPVISGNFVYMWVYGGGTGRLVCFNATDPNNITLQGQNAVSSIWGNDDGGRMAVFGTRLYVPSFASNSINHGITTVDISVPGTFTVLGASAAPTERISDVSVSAGGILVSQEFSNGGAFQLWSVAAGGIPVHISSLPMGGGAVPRWSYVTDTRLVGVYLSGVSMAWKSWDITNPASPVLLAGQFRVIDQYAYLHTNGRFYTGNTVINSVTRFDSAIGSASNVNVTSATYLSAVTGATFIPPYYWVLANATNSQLVFIGDPLPPFRYPYGWKHITEEAMRHGR